MMLNSALYIHIPFCERKCFYCSFVISVGQEHRMDDYCDAVVKEMQKHQGAKIHTIYFGGGTPSLLDKKNLEKLFTNIHQIFNIEENAEITLEANPKDLDSEKARFLRALGVSRLSIGAQTFNDEFLKYLGRAHTSEDILRNLDILQSAEFQNISMDLMFGFPQQTSTQIIDDIEMMTSLKLKHISLYSLTIEENSKFFTKKIQLNENEVQADHYCLVLRMMKDAGFNQYEVSNFSHVGFESKHNVNYWKGGNYIGLGVGAHSYIKGSRFWNAEKFQDYLDKINQGTSSEAGSRILDPYEQMMDAFLFGLRMNEGVELLKMQERYGCVLKDEVKQKLFEFNDAGLITINNDCFKVTDQGRLVLDELCVQLI